MILFFDVFGPTSIAYAIASGLAFGSTVILYISLRYPPRTPMSTRLLMLVTTLAAASAGSLFFAGQIVQAIATDPNWPRALARGALWEVFSVSIGVGLGIARSFAQKT
jgi:hypothetical protein